MKLVYIAFRLNFSWHLHHLKLNRLEMLELIRRENKPDFCPRIDDVLKAISFSGLNVGEIICPGPFWHPYYIRELQYLLFVLVIFFNLLTLNTTR